MKRLSLLAAGLSVFLGAPLVHADVWDEGGDPDNTCGGTPDNDLLHGADQVHDLGALPGPAVDQDFYTFAAQAYSSYEGVVDAITGDLNNGGNPDFVFERLNASCGVAQTAAQVGAGFSKSIRFESPAFAFGLLRVGSAACGTGCTAADQYHLRFYDTTYSIPRFNNSASQVTLLIIQNPTSYSIDATSWFFDGSGALLASAPFALSPRGTSVLNTASVPALAGKSGSIVISNTGRYGDLAGKVVSLEPATGFTFDTAMVPRPH
jgi:hypothetical protein